MDSRLLYSSLLPISKTLWALLCTCSIFLFGCHSFDDDEKFQKHTQGYIIHTKQGNTYALQYVPFRGGLSALPILTDSIMQNILCVENELFIPQSQNHTVQIFDVSARKMKETVPFDSDFYPVSIIQHPDKPEWFFIASENGKIAFYNRKKNKKEVFSYTNHLHHLVYANEKLYGATKNSINSELIIVDVPTRALIKKEPVPTGIKQLYSQTLWVRGISTDSLPVLYTFNVNDDLLQKSNYSYPLQKYAYSPYTQQFYGKEFIGFIENYQGRVYINQVQLSNPDFLQGFVADFEESRMLAFSNSKIYHYENMRDLVHVDSSLVGITVMHGTTHRK